MQKATHRGHCQVCNAIQKLPEDRLSLHGYTVQSRGWGGWFSGSCHGSHALPFERDKKLVVESIKRAREQAIAAHKESVKIANAYPNPAECWRHHYVNSGYVTGWIWIKVALLPGREDRPGFHPKYIYQETEHTIRNTFHDLDDAARAGNKNYAAHLQMQASQIRAYIEQQKERLKSWRPDAPLIPIVGE